MKEKRLVPNETMPEDKRYKLTMFDISGPPVLLLWMATLIQWPFFMFLPWIAFYFTECNGLGMPHYATWVWLFPLPILGFLLASVCRWFGCEGWDQIAQIWEDVIIQLPLFIASALPARLFCCKYVDFDCRSEKEGYNVFSCWPQNVAECQWTTSHIWHADAWLPAFDSWGRPCLFVMFIDVRPSSRSVRVCRPFDEDALKTLALLNRMVLVQEGQHQLQLERAKHTKHDLNRSTQILKMELRQMIPRLFGQRDNMT
eukprot:g28200.t1